MPRPPTHSEPMRRRVGRVNRRPTRPMHSRFPRSRTRTCLPCRCMTPSSMSSRRRRIFSRRTSLMRHRHPCFTSLWSRKSLPSRRSLPWCRNRVSLTSIMRRTSLVVRLPSCRRLCLAPCRRLRLSSPLHSRRPTQALPRPCPTHGRLLSRAGRVVRVLATQSLRCHGPCHPWRPGGPRALWPRTSHHQTVLTCLTMHTASWKRRLFPLLR